MYLLHVFGIAGALTCGIGHRDLGTLRHNNPLSERKRHTIKDPAGIARRAVVSLTLFSETSVRSSSHSNQPKPLHPSSPGP
jgi:hypothetical protein